MGWKKEGWLKGSATGDFGVSMAQQDLSSVNDGMKYSFPGLRGEIEKGWSPMLNVVSRAARWQDVVKDVSK